MSESTYIIRPFVNKQKKKTQAPAPAPPSTPAPAPAPRLCHVIKWNASEGYGFHLMADKKKPGHFIGKVDQGTPAELAGLRTGDRIVEVNGVNVANQVHKEVMFFFFLLGVVLATLVTHDKCTHNAHY